MKFVLLIIMLSFVLIYIYFAKSCGDKKIEGLNEGTAHYCNNCDQLTFGQCMECYNCGFCGKGNTGKCVRGTFTGPNNRSLERSCPRWYHNDEFWRYIHGNGDKDCMMKAFTE